MPRVKQVQFGIFVAFALIVTGTAQAHIKMKSPPPQSANNPLKDAPCGPSSSSRGSTMTMFASGQKITVEWDETIQHPGHYRIAFDDDGQDFPDPTSFTDIATEKNDLGKGVVVLLDGIMDMTGPIVGNTPYKVEVTLPDIECNNCTLQLIQVMTDKSPYGNGDDIYHECANLVLKRAAGAAAGSGGSAGTAAAGAAGTGAAGGATSAAGTGAAGSGAVAGAAGMMMLRPAGTGAAGMSGAAGMVGSPQSPVTGAGTAALAGTGATMMAPEPSSEGGCAVISVGARRESVVGVAVVVVILIVVGRWRRSRA